MTSLTELTKEKGAKGDVLPVSLPIHLGLGMNADLVAEARLIGDGS